MSAATKIDWVTHVWNPTRRCSSRSSGRVELIESKLVEPLSWRKPRERVFVNSTSDLFHESLPDEAIDRVFAVMALCPTSTFLVLMKRAARMREWFERCETLAREDPRSSLPSVPLLGYLFERAVRRGGPNGFAQGEFPPWPLPNVWLGVSVEDQATADERIPHLLQTPAALRFVSAEPLLERVDFRLALGTRVGLPTGKAHRPGSPGSLDGILVGGESGPNARPCDVAWVRSAVEQCREAQVPCFVKQLGARPVVNDVGVFLRDRKGGNPAEWPEDLRVREIQEEKR